MYADATSVRGALVDPGDAYKHVRRNFAKDAPDISVAHHALRVELAMNMTMKAVVPHSPEAPFYSMGRFEWGKLHNPHVHGFNGGASDPTLEVRPDMIWDASDPEQEVQPVGVGEGDAGTSDATEGGADLGPSDGEAAAADLQC